MAIIPFYKYQGAGNDFIIIDNRSLLLDKPKQKTVSMLCNRRLGIGADGLILLQNKEGFDFEMLYYNADGNIGSMCGNGGRCIVAFAKKMDIISTNCKFLAADGEHLAVVISEDYIELKMGQARDISLSDSSCFINTGSPHHISFVEDADKIDVFNEGRKIRYSETYISNGVNVNFVEVCGENQLKVYTYERGVEDETLACGTGVTAASLAYFLQKTEKKSGSHWVDIITKGANLSVKFVYKNSEFEDIWLCGPAVSVFKGEINIEI
jgi:diaminopimelate epimerase